MAFFQNSVLSKHLKGQDEKTVKAAYQKFIAYFHNPAIQQNIRDAKEEQFQEGFLRELFVDILGYTLNPQPEFNLTTELKNEKGAKKADGAILHNGKALGVIELKGTDTKDLDKINVQAFNYKNNQTGCVYVITSNFEKLRFFIHHSVEHLEFNLFTLTETEFQLLWLCLRVENLLNGVPLKVKEESLHEEEKITKQLYKDYAAFRNDLWQNMVKNNAVADKLVLFKKTQKLLDRFLFILFAEDSGLLPPNSISRILKRWEVLKAEDAYKPLYDIFKQYFGYIDTGRKGQKTVDDIFAYNGGLFLPDALLDTILLDDEILHSHVLKLTKYDFQSEVDVNILGHIFENSLNEIESITAQLEGQELDKSKTKRKKDGVFYTPKYITKYIVENTVGKLCDEKKEALGIVDEEYAKGRKNRKKDIIKGLDANLQAYRNWLLNITICDPACGSGAFLNQALEFLMEEHAYIDELESQLLGHAFEFPGVENHILEKNIFGVDINEESVDIAKLSLWLRTAQRGRKLTSLNNNLKCGNSLIDDPSVAGEKAFNWQKEFPSVFEKGGFDVVIGNPPYVRQELFSSDKPYLERTYNVYNGVADLYVYFFEKGLSILKSNHGFFSIIVANKWLKVIYAESLRRWLKTKKIIEIIDFGDLPVFADATAYPCIITLSNDKPNSGFKATQPNTLKFSSLDDYVINNCFEVEQSSLEDNDWRLVDNTQNHVLKKIQSCGVSLHSYTGGVVRRGIVTGCNEAFVIDEETRNNLIKTHSSSKDIIKPFLAGKDIKRNNIHFENRYLIFTRRGTQIDEFPAIKEYLMKFKEKLEPKPKDWKGDWKGRKPGVYKWYEIQDSIDYYLEFEKTKIIYPNICQQPEFTYDDRNFYTNQKCFIIPKDDKYLLGVLNSRVFAFLFDMVLPRLRGGFYEPGYAYMRDFPIADPQIDDPVRQRIIELVDNTLELNKKLKEFIVGFVDLLQSKFEIVKLSTKLQTWYELEFKDFLKELKKPKIQLSLSEEAEWMQYFNEQKQKALELKSEINKIDSEIDQMVYKLYGLTEEEVKIVEQN